MNLSPIILFVYNRPWHTKQTVEALQKNEMATDSELFIYSDGPRDTEESKAAVAEVRKYLKGVGGFKRITIAENSKNLGLANSVIKGISEVVNKYGRVIVLEDDLVTAPGFLRYMNQALERYEDEEQVMQISGHMFDVEIEAETDAIFLPFPNSWGWATWKRAWEHFDPLMTGYEQLKKDRRLRHKFNREGTRDFFNMLKLQLKGEIDSWAIRWYLSVFLIRGLTLFPTNSLVKNIGFDNSGTHCRNSPSMQPIDFSWTILSKDIQFPEISLHILSYQKIVNYFSRRRYFKEKLCLLWDRFKR